jgi:hypothetical protein
MKREPKGDLFDYITATGSELTKYHVIAAAAAIHVI